MSEDQEQPTGERLQRVLASRGVASRRAAEQLITDGRVSVNGEIVTVLGTRVDPMRDVIKLDGKALPKQKPRFLMLNKPGGFITTVKDERSRWTVMDLVDVPERVYPVGRLDRDTQGLLLLTNDGDVANRVMHPRYGITKDYQVLTPSRPSADQLEMIRSGLLIDDKVVKPHEIRLERETREGVLIKVVLHEGMYHIVRRMMETAGIEVVRLRRTRLGPLTIQGLPTGSWRDLTPGELVQLFEAVGLDRELADQANATRTMHTEPLGGFRHGTLETAPPRPQPQNRTAPSGDRPHGTRPSTGNRDRRPRRGR